jgi:hypothetical protein
MAVSLSALRTGPHFTAQNIIFLLQVLISVRDRVELKASRARKKSSKLIELIYPIGFSFSNLRPSGL